MTDDQFAAIIKELQKIRVGVFLIFAMGVTVIAYFMTRQFL